MRLIHLAQTNDQPADYLDTEDFEYVFEFNEHDSPLDVDDPENSLRLYYKTALA